MTLSPRPSPIAPPPPVTAVLLAGGMGRRMGSVDKGLQMLDGRPLAAWVLECLTTQASEVLINANRNRDTYAAFGHRVIEDRVGGFAGPLAGMQSGLLESTYELVAFAPCDTPFLPDRLVARLATPLSDDRIDLSVARTGEQAHPVICIARKRLLPHLTAFLDGGGRKVDAWQATLDVATVPFDDQPRAFLNINTIEELRAHNREGGT